MTIISLYTEKRWFVDWIIVAIWFISTIILASSFYIQYAKHIEPCTLCQWQRISYFLVIIAAPLGLFKRFNHKIRMALSAIFLLIFLLASYHVSIELGVLPDHCAVPQNIKTKTEFLQMLEQPKISCAQVKWTMLGVSAPLWNSFLSFTLLLILNAQFVYKPKVMPRFLLIFKGLNISKFF